MQRDVPAFTQVAPPEVVVKDVGNDEKPDAAKGNEQGGSERIGEVAPEELQIIRMQGNAGVTEGADGVKEGVPQAFSEGVTVAEVVAEEKDGSSNGFKGEDVADGLPEQSLGRSKGAAITDHGAFFAFYRHAAEQECHNERAQGHEAEASELNTGGQHAMAKGGVDGGYVYHGEPSYAGGGSGHKEVVKNGTPPVFEEPPGAGELPCPLATGLCPGGNEQKRAD